jgi:SAM-dependent methyltransferase
LKRGSRVLDIGSSNLYSASEADIRSFAEACGAATIPDDDISRMERGSGYGPNGGLNETFVGELLERCGIRYLSFDIAEGYATQVFDLNSQSVPPRLAGTFDVVLNFGTTEHVLDQANAMRVIHDATKVGGHIVHEVPSQGWISHGFFCYTLRFFFDLAGYNEYEVIEFCYRCPADGVSAMSIVRDYTSYFPALSNAHPTGEFDDFAPQNVAIYIVFRKTKVAPLQLPMERSTSVARPSAARAPSSVSGFIRRFWN